MFIAVNGHSISPIHIFGLLGLAYFAVLFGRAVWTMFGKSPRTTAVVVALVFVAGCAAAHLIGRWAAHLSGVPPALFGGSSLGGMLGVVGGAIVAGVLLQKPRFWQDAVAPVIAAHAIARLGCVFAGCCVARYDVWHAHRLPLEWWSLADVGCALAALAIARVVPAVPRAMRFQRGGIAFLAYLVMRFALEFARDDYRGVMGFTCSQFIIAAVVAGLLLVFMGRRVRTMTQDDQGWKNASQDAMQE